MTAIHFTHVHACTNEPKHARTPASMHAHMHARTRTHTHARTHARSHARADARTHTHTHTRAHARIRMHTLYARLHYKYVYCQSLIRQTFTQEFVRRPTFSGMAGIQTDAVVYSVFIFSYRPGAQAYIHKYKYIMLAGCRSN